MKIARTHLLARLALVAAVSVGLAACGGSSDNGDDGATKTPLEIAQDTLTAAQVAVSGLGADATDVAQRDAQQALLEAAKKVVEELGDDATHSAVTAAEKIVSDATAAIAAINSRIAAAQAATEAENTRAGLVTAASCTDGTQNCLDAHDALIAALRADVTRISDDPTATNADVTGARQALSSAETAREAVQTAYNTANPPPAPPPAPHACTAAPASDECVAKREEELAQLGDDDSKADHDTATKNLEDAKQALARLNDMRERTRLENAADTCVQGTEECLMAHDALIAALEMDVADLNDQEKSPTATNADRAAAAKALSDAEEAREPVKMAFDEANRDTVIGQAVTNAETEAGKLEDDRSAEAIQVAEQAITDAEAEIAKGDDADAFSDEIQGAKDAVARANARNGIDAAIKAAEDAAKALTAESTVADVTAVQGLLNTATGLVDGNDDHLSETEETQYKSSIAAAQVTVSLAKSQNDADEAAERMAQEKQETQDRIAKVAAAKALFSKIGKAMGAYQGTGANDRFGGYSDEDIQVSYGDGDGNATDADLSLDKDTTVDPLGDWTGQRFNRGADGDDKTTYEAHVYSYVGDPIEGRKFASESAVTEEGDYEYQFVEDTKDIALTDEGANEGWEMRVVLPSVTRSSGTETFDLPDRGPFSIKGSFHGVSGTYYCERGGAGCEATVVDGGFSLTAPAGDGDGEAGSWVFKADDPEDRLMDQPDSMYASFGWWMHIAEDGTPAVASAFHAARGTLPEITGFGGLQGTATYEGEAVGQYALTSATGGTNESGSFTATATLKADFDDGTELGEIEGTINDFKVGADGDDPNWSVKLNESDFTGQGVIVGDNTVWTIGSEAAEARGEWSGQLRNDTEDGDGDVPELVTGTFYSEYGTAGKMVGAFGAEQ